jgi:phosphoserine aminotransferase
VEYGASGQSVAEMSHRSKDYDEIIRGCESSLRGLMAIPENYKVLFLQGGASLQFASVPLNLLTKTGKADYVVSGQFSKKAYDEAKKYGDVTCVASSKEDNFCRIPELDISKFNPTADYFHICQNNTIYGTRVAALPETGDVPLVADMSSCILSEPYDVSKYGLIYAGAQKNMAPAGLTVVIVRDDLIGEPLAATPSVMRYKIMAENDSMYNTPPCYPIYMMGLVLEWIKAEFGGLAGMKAHNERKAAILYDYLDSSKLFKPTADKAFRSLMNVTFVTGSDDADKRFCAEAAKNGFVNLKGHRSVGGMRASIYNAMPIDGVEKLVEFMKEFEKNA